MHTSNSFSQSSAPTKNLAPPSPLPERERNKRWTRWAITVHQKFCSAKENITRCNFYAYENLLPNYSREYFAEWKPKRIHRSKNSLYNTEKNVCFVDVFSEKIYKFFTQKNPRHAGKDYQYHFTIYIFIFLVYPTVWECRFTRTFSILKFFRIFIIAHCQP